MNLLSVDWDFFFPTHEHDPGLWQFYDWGHNEGWGEALQSTLWVSRASAFQANGIELPVTSGEEDDFWNRFQFSEDAQLYIADSHTHAAAEEVMDGIEFVSNFDAHHDCGYSEDALKNVVRDLRVSCQDWMIAYHLMGSTLEVVYPRWKGSDDMGEFKPVIEMSYRTDDGKPYNDVVFDRIFVARSGSWTPPWVDDSFIAFVDNCPVQDIIALEAVHKRPWDDQLVTEEVNVFNALSAMAEELDTGAS